MLWSPRQTTVAAAGIVTRDNLKYIGVSIMLATRPSANTVRTGPFSIVWAPNGELRVKADATAVASQICLVRKYISFPQLPRAPVQGTPMLGFKPVTMLVIVTEHPADDDI